jgi:hypothetical protein
LAKEVSQGCIILEPQRLRETTNGRRRHGAKTRGAASAHTHGFDGSAGQEIRDARRTLTKAKLRLSEVMSSDSASGVGAHASKVILFRPANIRWLNHYRDGGVLRG